MTLGAKLHHTRAHRDCGGVANKQTGLVSLPEYVRWSQHCALGAIHRYHGGPGHQPWLYSNETDGESGESIVRRFLNLRMKLMPMLLAAGETATLEATPIVRRLDLVFPRAGANASRSDQYLFGDDILVAPFSGGWSDNGTATRDVWLGPGSWQDSWSGDIRTGPQTVSSTQPLGRVPMWHRQGGVVVTAPIAQTVEEQDWSVLGLELFPHPLLSKGMPHEVQTRRVVREGEAGEGTTITVQQTQQGQLAVEIAPSDDTPSRGWAVRVNLPPKHRLASAAANGLALSGGAVRTLQPLGEAESASHFPFTGGRPPSRAGPVAEVRLPQAAGRRSLLLQVEAL